MCQTFCISCPSQISYFFSCQNWFPLLGYKDWNFSSPLDTLQFSSQGKESASPACSRGYMRLPGCPVPSVSKDAIHSPDAHIYIYCIFGEGTTKVVEEKVALGSDVEIISGKVSKFTYTVSCVLEAKVGQVIPCFSIWCERVMVLSSSYIWSWVYP